MTQATLNLRMGPDRDTFGAAARQVAIPNAHEKYDKRDRLVRRWLNDVAEAVAEAPGVPILVHCASGKDGTGVTVAVLLLVLGVPREVIVAEYLLSDGEIERALDRLGDVVRYLDRVALGRVRRKLRG